MMEWLLGLWKKNKLLFWLLIIPIALAYLVKLYQEYQFGQAKKSLKEASKKSEKTKEKVAAQEAKAEMEKDKADEAQARIDERNKDKNLNLDWHKKK